MAHGQPFDKREYAGDRYGATRPLARQNFVLRFVDKYLGRVGIGNTQLALTRIVGDVSRSVYRHADMPNQQANQNYLEDRATRIIHVCYYRESGALFTRP